MNNGDYKLSKSLSWLLRHGAVTEGLKISPEGYIQIDELLQHKCFKGKYYLSDVTRVVNINSKQRFKLRRNPVNNELEIKANQGHSIDQIKDTELKPILEPKYETVVHGTYLKFWPSIKEHGLNRMRRKHIHFAKGIINNGNVISGVRYNVELYLFVNLDKALAEGLKFFESENGVILTEGNKDGYLELKYISKVIEAHTGNQLYPPTMEGASTVIPSAAYNVPSQTSSTTPSKSSMSIDAVPAEPAISPKNGIQGQSSATPSLIPITEPPMSTTNPNISLPSTSSSGFKKAPISSAKSSPSKNVEQSPAKRSIAPQKAKNQSNNQSNTSTTVEDESISSDKPIRDLCKVEVSGYPGFTKSQDLMKLFSNYGQIKVEQLSKKYAVISFETNEKARKALKDSNKICLYGQFITLKPYTGIEDSNRNKKTISAATLVEPERLALVGSFGEQLAALLAAVRLTQEEVAALATLYADLERVLQPLWPGCQAMPFGSITTGLGIKSSDADCFMNIPPQYRHAQFSFVNRARRALLQYPQLFAEVFAIPRANTPIVKLLHVPTRTRCDLSFKTPLGALNSKLVAFLLHADCRLVPTAVAIKYWASVHALSGTGRITNYALTLLFVFFLQRRGLLPPVVSLQRDPAHHVIVDGWDSGFSADYSRLPRINDPASVADLLGDFFNFYTHFDFETLVVCPFLGRPIPKAQFADSNLLPPEFERYKRNIAENLIAPLRFKLPICVQDPFEQSHNVASSVTTRLAADFRGYVQFAAEIYEKEKATGCQRFLRTILVEKPPVVRAKLYPEYRVNFYPRLLDNLVHEDWRATFREAVVTVFEQILKLKLTPDGKLEKTRNGREKEEYVTTMTKPLWRRKRFCRLYEATKLSFIEKHSRVTEEIIQIERSHSQVDFQVILSFGIKFRSVFVSIRLIKGDEELFFPFGKYFMSAMHNWVIGVLNAMESLSTEDNVNKLDSDVTDSNVANSDFDSDSVLEDDKETLSTSSPEAEHPAIVDRAAEAQQPGSSEIVVIGATEGQRDEKTDPLMTVDQGSKAEQPAENENPTKVGLPAKTEELKEAEITMEDKQIEKIDSSGKVEYSTPVDLK